ncbi:MAG: hypothetical protein BroJett040_01220 [Oligoflexia bacterium]|nr:MAG: hypothetical protein BroJett040_01220 [Oligoflexia bacterium]
MGNDPKQNSTANVVQMDRFHFNTLSKHMKPLYADLVLHENATPEKKREIAKAVCRNFYRRVREYRKLTVDRAAEICRVSSDEIEALERGEKDHERWLINRFIRACGADSEYEVFFQKILEFKEPKARTSVRDLAIPLLKRGLLIPGMEYRSLHSKRGEVVSLFNKNTEDNPANATLSLLE